MRNTANDRSPPNQHRLLEALRQILRIFRCWRIGGAHLKHVWAVGIFFSSCEEKSNNAGQVSTLTPAALLFCSTQQVRIAWLVAQITRCAAGIIFARARSRIESRKVPASSAAIADTWRTCSIPLSPLAALLEPRAGNSDVSRQRHPVPRRHAQGRRSFTSR